jgi:hypothetical protein
MIDRPSVNKQDGNPDANVLDVQFHSMLHLDIVAQIDCPFTGIDAL